MSDQFNRGGKNDGSKKFQSINLSSHFNKPGPKTAAKSTTGRGLQSLGKVSTRRVPRPANLSSLKKENAGNDPNVALVPGTGGWGSKKEIEVQVESVEGDKGWKEMGKAVKKPPAFSQDFPSLGEEAPQPNDRLELRPQTGKWGETPGPKKESAPTEEPVAQLPINQPFGMVQMPMYGMVPVPGSMYPGVPGAIFRPIYPPGPQAIYNGAPPPALVPYMYAAPPSFPKHTKESPKHTKERTNSTSSQGEKTEVQKCSSPKVLKAVEESWGNSLEPVPDTNKSADHWGDEAYDVGTVNKVPAAPVEAVPQSGYFSPYTQPYPGHATSLNPSQNSAAPTKSSSGPALEERHEPAGKAADDGKKITYHGRTSSHSSMSETPEDELAHDFEDKLDLNSNTQQARVISRSLAKKQLKAFPREDDSPIKQTTKQVSIEQDKGEDKKAFAWDEDSEEVGKKSVWEERQKQQEVKSSAWNMPSPRPEADGQPQDNDHNYYKNQVGFLDEDECELKPRTSRTSYNRYNTEFQANDRRRYDDRRETQYRQDDSSYRQSDRSYNGAYKTERDSPSDARRKAIEETSKILKSLPNKKSPKHHTEESEPPVQIQIKKPQQVEILQKPPQPEPNESDKPKQPENYWEAKQLEREKKEQEQERTRKEKQRIDALKVRSKQYQDYRTLDQYVESRDSREDHNRRRPMYDDERSEREKERRGIRRRGEDDAYNRPERGDRKERFERVPRHPREERGEARRDYRRRDDRVREYRPREARDRYQRPDGKEASDKERPQRNRSERSQKPERQTKPESDEVESEQVHEFEQSAEDPPIESQEVAQSEPKQVSEECPGDEALLEDKPDRKPKPERNNKRNANRDRRERYDREYTDRPDRERSYRREPRIRRDRRPRYNDQNEVLDSNNTDRNGNPLEDRPERSRNERYRSDRQRVNERKRVSTDERKPTEDGADELPAPRPRREHRETKFVPRVPASPASTATTPTTPTTETPENSTEERPMKGERESRRGRKGPSLRYYNPNPAERVKQRTRPSAENVTGDKKKDIGEKRSRQERSERPAKGMKSRPKKEPIKKEEKPEEVPKIDPTKRKDCPIEDPNRPKPKKTERRETEHDRLLRMTKSGVDLTRMGIYAVEGKDIEETNSQAEGCDTDGFVEVVRKKPKKEIEPERVEKKTSSGKSKKTKKSDKSKKTVDKDQQGTTTPTTTANSSSEKLSPIMKWSGGALIDTTPLFGSNIWARKNAWEKPLTFTDKQTIEAKELLAPLTSGESTSLFSSDADLAKKIRAKFDDKSWKNGDSRPPRFTKMLPDKHKERSKHHKSKESLSDSAVEKAGISMPLPQRANMKKRADVIPPGVEDLFGLRSDGEEDKPTLSSLVHDSAPAPVIIPAVCLSQKSGDSSEVVRECQTSPDITDRSAETSTQTTPPAIKHPDQEPPQVVPSAPPEEPDSPQPLNSPNVEQLITSAAGMSLTEQLREIGQAQSMPPLGAPMDRSQLFGTMPFGMQGSPLGLAAMQNSQMNLAGLQEPPLTPPTSISQHLMNFAPPREMQNSPHSLLHMNSPRQMGPLGAPGSAPFPMNNQIIGNTAHHGINSSSFSNLANLTNLTNQRPTSADFLKSYISPMSPTNKVYAAQNQSSFVNQTIHQFMSTPFMSNSGNYPSPTMSPQPSQPFNQPIYQTKPVSPKIQPLYNTPTNMFEAVDMMSNQSINQRQSQSSLSLASQQMFYQMQQRFNNRMMSTDMHQLYTMKHNDNILLQSDMTKHVDAKPFNPSLGVPPLRGMNMFKPDMLQQAMMSQQAPMMPRYPMKHHTDPRRTEFVQQMKKEEMNMNMIRPQSAVSAGSLQNNMQQVPNFLQQQQQQQQQRMSRPDIQFMPQNNMVMRPQRSAPRVKLARDGRLHRMPDMMTRKYSNQGSSLIPHALQQQMQQQSLAQVQQYTAALSEREENAPKATLPDNMKPSPKKSSDNMRFPGQRIPPETRPISPVKSPVQSPTPPPPPSSEDEKCEEEREEEPKEESDEPPIKRQAEKRKYNDREPRPYRGGREYRMEYNGYDGFNGYANDYGPPSYRGGGYRGGYPPRYPPPHRGMYRGGSPFPRGPPRGHPDHYRGGRGRPRY